jgi:hypothetical protein
MGAGNRARGINHSGKLPLRLLPRCWLWAAQLWVYGLSPRKDYSVFDSALYRKLAVKWLFP